MLSKLNATTTVFRSSKSRSGFFQIREQKAWTKFVVKLFTFVGIPILIFTSFPLFWGWGLCLCNYLLHDLLPSKQRAHPRTSKRVYKVWENYILLNFTTATWGRETYTGSFPKKAPKGWERIESCRLRK